MEFLCLTKDPKNSLMYDYYSNGHKGICIGFDWKRLKLMIKGTNQHKLPRQILYRSGPPEIDPLNVLNFDEVFFTKWANQIDTMRTRRVMIRTEYGSL